MVSVTWSSSLRSEVKRLKSAKFDAPKSLTNLTPKEKEVLQTLGQEQDAKRSVVRHYWM